MGASNLQEVVEHTEELVAALGSKLRPLEARRLQREGLKLREVPKHPEMDARDPRKITAKAGEKTTRSPWNRGTASTASVASVAGHEAGYEVKQRRAVAQDPWLHSDPWSEGATSRPSQELEKPPKKEWNRPSSSRPGFLEARLVVKQGAGISLLWCAGEGYRVQEIEEFPGQPELRVGDIIRSIGGLSLIDAGSVEEAERRFAAAFRDAAHLEIERPCFTVSLKVKAQGAGLSLVWHPPEGYLVEAVESSPGQVGLRAGDVLRRVGPAALGGHTSQSAADSALANALQDGAMARVFRPSCDPQLGDLVSTGSMILPSVAVGTWSWGNESFGHGLRAGSCEAKDAVAAAFNAAVRYGSYFFDTAPTYGRGFAEESLGHLCRSTGQYAVVATKHFPRANQDLTAALLSTAKEAAGRLALDGPVDLLQLHRPAEPPTSLEEQADALAAVIRAGAAKAIGVCNFSLQELRVVQERLQRQGLRLSTCQVEFSLARQLPMASGLVNGCRELGITVLAFSPLAMGRLSGRYDPWGPAPAWSERRPQRNGGAASRPFGATLDEDVDAWHQLLTKLQQMGQKYGKTCAQVAINWVLCQGAVALCGAKDGAQAAENAGAMGWRLSMEDALLLGALGARGRTSDFQHG